MIAEVDNGSRCGIAKAPPSKSYAHRLLIAAALSDREVKVGSCGHSDDIGATIDCLRQLGAGILRLEDGSALVRPIEREKSFSRKTRDGNIKLRCGESGSTLRFLIPVAGALGKEVTFEMEGRLPERPVGDYARALENGGMKIVKEGNCLKCSGRLRPGEYVIPGNVSSQFVSGLLFALPLLKGSSRITVTGKMQSEGYADMTAGVIRTFGIGVEKTGEGYLLENTEGYKAPDIELVTEEDWSGAAFLLAAGAFSQKGITVTGLNKSSVQGDRRIVEILERFGANVTPCENRITVKRGDLKGIVIDAGEIPDLVPALAVTACGAEGETRIVNAARLRFKETDRIKTTVSLINSLGGIANETEDGLVVKGAEKTGGLRGGKCDSFSDHRIAMSAALSACIAKEKVVISGAECVSKSFPDFFEVFGGLEKEIRAGDQNG